LDRIALVALIVVVGMLLLAAQRFFANQRRNSAKVPISGFDIVEIHDKSSFLRVGPYMFA